MSCPYTEEERNDYDFMLKAVQSDGSNYQYASDELKEEWDIVYAAVKENSDAYQWIPDEYRDHATLALIALKQDDRYLEDIPEQLWRDEEFLKEALKLFGIQIMEDVPTTLKNDFDWMHGLIYKVPKNEVAEVVLYASNELQSNSDFMLEAIDLDFDSIERVSGDLRKDPNFALAIIENMQNFDVLDHVDEPILDDPEFFLAVLEGTEFNDRIGILGYASNRLRNDQNFMLEAFKIEEEALEYALEELKSSPTFMLKAITYDIKAIKYSSWELLKHANFAKSVLMMNGLLLKDFRPEIKGNINLVEIAIKQNPLSFIYVNSNQGVSREALKLAGNQIILRLKGVKTTFKRKRFLDAFSKEEPFHILFLSPDFFEAIMELIDSAHLIQLYVKRDLWNNEIMTIFIKRVKDARKKTLKQSDDKRQKL